MTSLVIQYMEYLEDGTARGKLDGLFDGMPLRQEDGTILGYSVGDSVGSSKVYK